MKRKIDLTDNKFMLPYLLIGIGGFIVAIMGVITQSWLVILGMICLLIAWVLFSYCLNDTKKRNDKESENKGKG